MLGTRPDLLIYRSRGRTSSPLPPLSQGLIDQRGEENLLSIPDRITPEQGSASARIDATPLEQQDNRQSQRNRTVDRAFIFALTPSRSQDPSAITVG